MISFRARRALLLAGLALAIPGLAGATGESRSWDFSVLLDGDEIGYHRFELTENGDERRIKSEAKFDVRFLIFNAFRYRHTNTETWSDGCLRHIEARTESNNKTLSVSGATVEDRLVIDAGTSKNVLSECVMTFAYWDPRFLEQPRLLNSQSGDYLDVEVEPLGRELITVRGEKIPADAYKLQANKIELTLWYSTDNEWLALESIAKGGRIIRYELS